MNTNIPEIMLQHGQDHLRVRFLPNSGVIFLRKIASDGSTIAGSQEVIEVAKHDGLECIHDGTAWYPPLLVRVLRLYDDQQEDDTLPWFIHRHYMKNGRSLV